jgi:hypothetical protein
VTLKNRTLLDPMGDRGYRAIKNVIRKKDQFTYGLRMAPIEAREMEIPKIGNVAFRENADRIKNW